MFNQLDGLILLTTQLSKNPDLPMPHINLLDSHAMQAVHAAYAAHAGQCQSERLLDTAELISL